MSKVVPMAERYRSKRYTKKKERFKYFVVGGDRRHINYFLYDERNLQTRPGKIQCPLSPGDWIMFLSGEINLLKTLRATLIAIVMAILFIFLTCVVTVVCSSQSPCFKISASLFFVILYVVLAVYLSHSLRGSDPKKEKLEDLRKEVMKGKLADSDEICRKWLGIDSKKIKFP
jgi:membrane protein implicated in regulation of membrane protease activity